jgi:hypothetical protein
MPFAKSLVTGEIEAVRKVRIAEGCPPAAVWIAQGAKLHGAGRRVSQAYKRPHVGSIKG